MFLESSDESVPSLWASDQLHVKVFESDATRAISLWDSPGDRLIGLRTNLARTQCGVDIEVISATEGLQSTTIRGAVFPFPSVARHIWFTTDELHAKLGLKASGSGSRWVQKKKKSWLALSTALGFGIRTLWGKSWKNS